MAMVCGDAHLIPVCTACGALATPALQARWSADALVHSSPRAQIYRGHDRTSGALVAIKVATRSAFASAVAQRPADIHMLCALRHPHLVATLAIEPVGESEIWIQEWIEGITLDRWFGTHAPLAPAQTAGVVGQILDALSALHQRHWFHGDIKPQNVMIDAEGQVQVIDLGLLRSTLADAPQSALERHTAGTLPFMAPELQQGLSTVDDRADLYAVGVLLEWLQRSESNATLKQLSKGLQSESPLHRPTLAEVRVRLETVQDPPSPLMIDESLEGTNATSAWQGLAPSKSQHLWWAAVAILIILLNLAILVHQIWTHGMWRGR